MEENYSCFKDQLVHQQNLNFSLLVHNYCSKEISFEESFNITHKSIELVAIEDTNLSVNLQDETETTHCYTNQEEKVYCHLEGSQTDYVELEIENQSLREEIKELKCKLQKKAWGVDKIRDDDEMTKFYTGLPTFNIFMWLFTFLKPKAERMTYWGMKENKTYKRTRKLALSDEFLAVMMRLKVGLFHQDIADRFEISITTFSIKSYHKGTLFRVLDI